MKAKIEDYATRIRDLEFLFQQLQTRSDEESSLLLALIRLKADIDKIVKQLRKAPEMLSVGKSAAGNPPMDLLVLVS